MAIFYFAFCIFCLHFNILRCSEFQRNGIDSNFGVHKENSTLSLEYDKVLSKRSVCDCGPKSKSCKLEEGKKVCECNFRYRQVDGFCEPYCKKKGAYQCDNGARCVGESCQCLPGTKGDFCQIVEECEGAKGAIKCGDPDKINCDYDSKTQKAFCECRTYEYEYDESSRRCVECDCDKQYGSCSLVNGVKTCKCNPGAALRPDRYDQGNLRCAACDCGNNSNGCSFEDESGYGYWYKVCDCKEGYFHLGEDPVTCVKCECGPHGTCHSERRLYVGCDCDDGYKPFVTEDRKKVFCKECDCGGNGVCSFENQVKKCKCDKLFAERNGKCVACQCYANDKTVDCFFEGKTQHCLCPDGYKNGTFFCQDINECLEKPDVCPSNTECRNTEGSFECPCVKGYKPRNEKGDPKAYGCEDIDECENESMCPTVHTRCINLDGTYECECEWGHEPMAAYESAVIAGCQEMLTEPASSPGNTGVIIVLVVVGLIIAVGLVISIFIKRRSARHRQLPTTDTALESLK